MTYRPVQRLKPGDTVAIVAPSGPFDRPTFEAGAMLIARRYAPAFGEGIYDSVRYLAGNDDRRWNEFHDAMLRDRVRGIFCARGGYGAMRLLDRLPVEEVRDVPLIGFSDITALHALWLRAGYRCVHGPVLTQLGKQAGDVVEKLLTLLESDALPVPLSGTHTVVPGVAEGPLLGGNMSVLTRLLGTPWMPSLQGAILLLEDVAERPYRLDRMWTHLKLAGVLDQVAGFALGDFTLCEEKGADYAAADVLDDLVRAEGKPCIRGFPIGHGSINVPVVLGAKMRLDGAARTLEALEPLVAAS